MAAKIIVPKVATLENVALEIGDVISIRNLAIAPLYGDDSFKEASVLLSEAIKTGNFTVTESSEVKSLTIENKLPQSVFIAEGQIVEGSSQNRMAIYSTLVPSHSGELYLPVRCVQHGQGLLGRSRYNGSNTVAIAPLRGNQPDQTLTTLSMPSGRYVHRNDQQTTWDTITHVTQVFSRTQIMDLSDVRKENFCDVVANAKLQDYLDDMKKTADPNQIGYAAVIGRSDGGFDLYTDFFGSQNHLNGLYEKLLTSAAFVAKLHNQDSIYKHKRDLVLENINRDTFVPFLERIAKADVDRVRKVGEPQSPLERDAGTPSYMWLDSAESPVRRTVGKGELYRLRGLVDGSVLLTAQAYVQAFAKHTLN